ncbi:MAG: NAD(P)/FAD-dependent oxidoreductase, partial [Candidatus Thiodiazotropha sp. (ex Gloverina cf. vestifex)]|nr:NAD(P)/FAD-dependent oxidoreductase [Candidatus Thiodiazotropha sp. (ex Gloverina cf. vestifex)]
MHYIVLGAGPAGVTACENIRELDATGRITLVTGEAEPPYARMAIPYLLVEDQACRYLVKDFGTSESPKSTRQRDSRYAPT